MTTIESVLDAHGVPYQSQGHEHCRAGWVQLDCPHCSPGAKRWRLGYNVRYGYLNCWQCGKLDARATLATLCQCTPHALQQALAGVIRHTPREAPRTRRLTLPVGIEPLPPWGAQYIRSRNLEPETMVRLWGVQGIGLQGGHLAWRLFIPINAMGRTVSWTTRSISDGHATRYRSASESDEEIPHKSLLYGEEYARSAIIIVEGPLDTWTIGPGCVATCGTSYSQAQLAKMSRYAVRVVCFDNEPKAQTRAAKLVRDLAPFAGETYNVTLNAKDANAADRREIEQLRQAFLPDLA